jgi:MFS family permease
MTAIAAAPPFDASVNPYWRRNLYVCLFGSFTNMAGMTLLLPFLPNYIHDLGVQDADAIVFWSAAAFSAAFLAAAMVSPIWGWLADLYGRKPMLVRASLGMAVAISMMGLAHNVYELVALRAASGFLGGYTSGCVILVASQTPRDRSAWALGKLSIGALSGSLLGPLIGGVLPGLIGLRDTFFLAGSVIFITFLLTTFVIREDKSLRPQRKNGKLPNAWKIIPDKRPILAMLASATLLMLANMSVEPIITVFVGEIASPGQNIVLYAGAAMSAAAFAAMLAAPTIGRYADRHGHWRVIVVSLAVAGVALIPQGFAMSPWQLIVLRFIMGLALAGLLPAITALIRRRAPDAAMGRILGFSQSAQYLGQILGPMAGATVSAHFGMRAVFFATAIVMLIGAGVNEMVRRVAEQPRIRDIAPPPTLHGESSGISRVRTRQ